MNLLNKDLRRRIVEQAYKHNFCHLGSSMSCVDAIKFLYDEVIWPPYDKFILSKGHGALALYAVLESKGYNPTWKVHSEYNGKQGIFATTGSLGHGLGLAAGRAYAKKLKKETGKIFCMVGDGELQEGNIWEVLGLAESLNLDNLVIFVDYNKYQSLGSILSERGDILFKIQRRFEGFATGIKVKVINGHNLNDFSELYNICKNCINVFILDTIKGKGIPYLEKNPSVHVCKLTPEIYTETMKALE